MLSSLGVAFSVTILVVGMFLFDGITYMIDLQFRQIQREDLTISFVESLDAAVAGDLSRLEGVRKVETFRMMPARLRSQHHKEEAGIQGMVRDGRLRRIVSADGITHPLPPTGLVLSAMLADKLDVIPGDFLDVEVLEGRRARKPVQVVGTVEDFLGLAAYMDLEAVHRLVEGPALISGAYLAVEADQRGQLTRGLKKIPTVSGVASPASMLASFESQMAEGFLVGVSFLAGFASVIAVGVIYNGARISLSERGRELASLRVMGFRRREVSTLLLGEQALITLMAIPVGLGLGYLFAAGIISAIDNEVYRIPFVIEPGTYLASSLITVAAAAFSGAIVRRRIDRLDLIAVLKTRE
jgi:putative ABC transport system permease protein